MLGLSLCRNPKLAAVFYRLKLIEAYGTGMPKIMNAYSGYSVKPKIEATNNAFKITLPNCNYKTEGSVEGGTESDYETRIIGFIKDRGFAVRSDIDALLGVSQSTASRILRQMIKSELIYSEGRGKNTRYRRK